MKMITLMTNTVHHFRNLFNISGLSEAMNLVI